MPDKNVLEPGTIPEGHRSNFHQMLKAASNGHLGLVQCTRKSDGKSVTVICIITPVEGGGADFVPLAELFSEKTPFDQWEPPPESLSSVN